MGYETISIGAPCLVVVHTVSSYIARTIVNIDETKIVVKDIKHGKTL